MFTSGQKKAFFFTTFVLCSHEINGHVSLTFPKARGYGFDFLDTERTPTPCGGEKRNPFHMRNLIENGQSILIQWHLGYPHQGGFRVELLDANDNLLRFLTPPDTFVGDDVVQSQSDIVDIPDDLTCYNCTVRLVRQALEWGDTYQFQSCADVDIVKKGEDAKNDKAYCSGFGRYDESSENCECLHLHFGRKCEFKNDCMQDTDCNNNGKCIDIKGTTLPSKQCFCKPGYFGLNCKDESSIKNLNFPLNNHQKFETKDKKFTFYWKTWKDGSQDIMEGVIKAQTESWVAVGWRPKGLSAECQSFPEDAATPKLVGGKLHEMDCTDMIIGSVQDGSYFRVGDYYTRDRSTPKLDSDYNYDSERDLNLIGAIGLEKDGETTIAFQRTNRKSYNVKTDHDFSGELFMIWAFGRSDLEFYVEDELKYHGRNRGHFDLDVNVNSGLINLPNIIGTSIAAIFVIIYQLL